MADNVEFDTERFILAIKDRSALWDMLSDAYSDKNVKKRMWEEVTDLFGGDQISNATEKTKLCQVLQRKWKNIKDSYAREKRRLSGVKSGSAAERKSAYIYFNILNFLNTNTPPTNTHSSISTEDPDETQIEPEAEPSTSRGPYETRVLGKKRKPQDEVGQQLIKVLKDSAEDRRKRENDVLQDEDRLFMLSLASDFKKVPEELKLSVKRQLLAVLEDNQARNISARNDSHQYQGQHNYLSTTYPRYNQQYPQGGNNFQFHSQSSTPTPARTTPGSDYGGENSASILSCFDSNS